MNINITCKNIQLDAPLKVFVEEKMDDVARVLSGSEALTAQVEIGIPSRHHHSGPVFYAEATIKVGSTVLRANSEHHDLRAAIVDVKESLQAQATKLKTKAEDLARTPTEQ